MEKYSWNPIGHGFISIQYLGEEVGQTNSITKALAIETLHRSERKDEAHNIFNQSRQQIQNSSIDQRKCF